MFIKKITTFFLLIFVLLVSKNLHAQNTFPSSGKVGIGTTTPDASSLLEVKSTTKGILIPRMTQAQRNAITSPATGLFIYVTDTNPGFYFYSGTSWVGLVAKNKGWLTTGNSSLDSASNFIGTTDYSPFSIRTNNTERVHVSSTGNVGIGTSTPTVKLQVTGDAKFNNVTVGLGSGNIYSNTALGNAALSANTTGNFNLANGYNTLPNNTTGFYNTAVGASSLVSNTTGVENTAIGTFSQSSNITGNANSSMGTFALTSNTSGSSNTSLGFTSSYSNTTGSDNTITGTEAFYFNTTGSNNTATGYYALESNTTGSNNHSYGNYSLFHNTTGIGNIAMGSYALYSNSTCSNQLAIGDSALYNSVLNNAFATEPNLAVGSAALFANTSGYENTALGYQALYSNTSGSQNTAVGHDALHSNTFAQFNTAVGETALYYNTGYGNTALGYAALDDNTTAGSNVAVGNFAMAKNTTGYSNTASGAFSLSNNTTGSSNTSVGDSSAINDSVSSYNTEIGKWAGFITSGAPNGNFNTFIGYFTGPTIGGFSNCSALGNSATPTASNQIRFGNSAVTSIGGQVSYTTFSDGRFKKNIKQNVPGLAFINQLKPITYTLDITGIKQFKGEDKKDNSAATKTEDAQNEKTIHTGFIAQDVEATAKKMSYEFDGVDAAKNSKDLYGLRYDEFVVPLVKAVQELSKKNDVKDSTISNLQKQIDDLKAIVLVGNQSSSNVVENKQTIELGSDAALSQNIPNPFSNLTVISYNLPVNNGNAYINFYGVSGSLLKTVKLTGNGKGTITLKASELASGTYHYALLVDGKVIDSKQMISSK